MAAAAAAAEAATDDGFDDLFGAGFEELSDGEEGETGEEAERVLHAKVRRCNCHDYKERELRAKAACGVIIVLTILVVFLCGPSRRVVWPVPDIAVAVVNLRSERVNVCLESAAGSAAVCFNTNGGMATKRNSRLRYALLH